MSERPQVYVNVSGGIAEATVTRGDVEVIQVDWDNENDAPDSESLLDTRAELEKVADEKYRTRLLADIDELIGAAREEEATEEWAQEVRVRNEELTKLRIAFEVTGGRGIDLAERIDTLEREIEEINERYEKESATK